MSFLQRQAPRMSTSRDHAARRPVLSQASRPLTVTIPATNELGETVPTAIAGEHPLTL